MDGLMLGTVHVVHAAKFKVFLALSHVPLGGW